MKNHTQNRGVALVVTLAMIAMLTFLVVAYFSRTIVNSQIESASTGIARADILAKSAGEIIVGDFKAEIVAGSDPVVPNDPLTPIYRPLPQYPENAIPTVSRYTGFPIPVPGTVSPYVNLVKQSTTDRFFPVAKHPNANPVILSATLDTTDVPSQNRKAVINKRWDDPAATLVPMGPLLLVSPPNQTYTRFYTNAMLPHWVMMTRQGVPASQTWTTDWKDYSSDNTKAAIGRFAYNVYDVGGLLDVNTAGYPESGTALPPTVAIGQKGTLGLAQLSTIPGIDNATNATQFVQTWRNLASGTKPEDYLAYLGFSKNGTADLTTNPFFMFGPKSGYTKLAVGTSSADNRILGRQDLIRLAIKLPLDKNGVATSTVPTYGLTLTSLAYLTHFSRELNAPSWAPLHNASDTALGGSDGTAASGPKPYAYNTNQDNGLVPNRFFPKVRVPVSASWQRLTGEKVVGGEPLLKYRFPLSWLALLQSTAPGTSSWTLTPEATAIVNALEAQRLANGGPVIPGANTNAKAAWLVQHAFGLTWNTTPDATTRIPANRWDYTGSTGAPGSAVQTTLELLGDSSTPGATVVNESREPNFFELIKAGILSGSLGNSSDFESLCASIGEDSNPDYHVIQIGANIIDQADSDSYPTRIAFGYEMDPPPRITVAMSSANAPQSTGEVKVFAGVEDVPYIHSFVCTPYRIPAGQPNLVPATDPGSLNQNASQDSIDAWLQFVLWKPQQQAAPTSAPTSFRVLFTGSDVHIDVAGPIPGTVFPFGSGVTYDFRYTAPVLGSQPGTNITFTDSPTAFRTPAALGGNEPGASNGFYASQPEGRGTNPRGNAPLPRGMWLGETYRPEQIFSASSPNITAPPTGHIEFASFPDSRFDLQYQDVSGNWRTYQRYDRFGIATGRYFEDRGRYGLCDDPTNQGKQGNPHSKSFPNYTAFDVGIIGMSSMDPRSQRYGVLRMYLDAVPPLYTQPTIFAPSGVTGDAVWKYYLKQGWAPSTTTPPSTITPPYNGVFGPSNARFTPNWSGGGLQNPWASHSGNSPILDPTKFWADDASATASTYYKDLDGVVRRADGDSANNVRPVQLSVDASGKVLPYNSNGQDLGVVMNRPFRSVGELAYVFRDEPYKSLNLFTDKSADSALLDLFCVNAQPAVVAGKVNLNTRVPAVLQSVIVGASRQELSTSNPISSADALTIATNLVKNTSDTSGTITPPTGPLLNPAEIANRLATILPVGSTPDYAIKTRREVVGRALAGSGQTRTWNFLVDVIAQSGRYTPNATQSSQFVVEGEKRYWLHVAIDRYTGQVIDQQLEPVME